MPDKTLKLPASAATNNPVASPLGPASISGTTITVDDYVNQPTRIPGIIRELVAANRGYFAERIFDTPGFTVEGGAVIYEQTFPEDFFLPSDQSLAPRAPGSEAARLGSTRRAPSIAYPESLAGQIEVTDEARRRNNVLAVRRQFTQAANTFANIIQLRAIEVMDAFVTSTSREHAATVDWDEAHSSGIPNADPAKLPQTDFAYVQKLFLEDEAGVQPGLLILGTDDAFTLAKIYGKDLPALLDLYGLELLVSPRVTKGNAYFVKEGGIGVMAFETPLSQEQERVARKKTDYFVLEATPVFVAIDASAILKLTTLNG